MKWEKIFLGWIFNGATENEYWFRKNEIANPLKIFYLRVPQSVSDILFQKFLMDNIKDMWKQ